MGIFLNFAFLFAAGSLLGWVIELLFRRFIAKENVERKWINPGFCSGPYLPLYGCGLCALYIIASVESFLPIGNAVLRTALLILLMTLCMTAIEYVAGVMCLKLLNVRLWDYSNEWGNIQGIICPKYSIAWAALCAVYYFLIHPCVLAALDWLAQTPTFSFFIGAFFGVFLVDAARSAQLAAKFRRFAEEYAVILRYEAVKAYIKRTQDATKQRFRFFRPFRSERPLYEHLKELLDTFESKISGRGEKNG